MNSTHCLLVFKRYKNFISLYFYKNYYIKNHVIHNTEKRSCSTVGIISLVNVDRSAKFKNILVK